MFSECIIKFERPPTKTQLLLYLKNLRKIKTEKINKIFNNERINILPNTNLTLN